MEELKYEDYAEPAQSEPLRYEDYAEEPPKYEDYATAPTAEVAAPVTAPTAYKVPDFFSKATLTAALPVDASVSQREPAIATLDRSKYFLEPIPKAATESSQSGMVAGALDWSAGFDKDLYNERKRASESNLASAIQRAQKTHADSEALKARADAGEKITKAEADATMERARFEYDRFRIAEAEHDAISKADAPLWRSFAASAAKGGLSTAASGVDAGNAAKSTANETGGMISDAWRDTKNLGRDLLESVTGIYSEREQPPAAQEAAAPVAGLAGELRAAATQASDYYSANPNAQNLGAQVGRAGGSFLAVAPTLAMGGLGLPAAVAQMAGMTYEDAYTQKEQELISQGGMSAAEIDEASQQFASEQAVAAAPHLAVYMVGGKLATMGVGRVMRNASTLSRTVAGFAAGTAANVTVGGGFRVYEQYKAKKEIDAKLDEKFPGWRERAGSERAPEESEMLAQREKIPGFMPSIEQLTTDALWGAVHAKGEYAKGKQMDSAREIVSGTSPEIIRLEEAVTNPNITARQRYDAALQLDALTKGATNLLAPLKPGEVHEADPKLAGLLEQAKAEEAGNQAKIKARVDAKSAPAPNGKISEAGMISRANRWLKQIEDQISEAQNQAKTRKQPTEKEAATKRASDLQAEWDRLFSLLEGDGDAAGIAKMYGFEIGERGSGAAIKAPTVLSEPANDSTKLFLATPPAAPVYGVKPAVPEISNAKPEPIPETKGVPFVPPPVERVQLPAARGDADIQNAGEVEPGADAFTGAIKTHVTEAEPPKPEPVDPPKPAEPKRKAGVFNPGDNVTRHGTRYTVDEVLKDGKLVLIDPKTSKPKTVSKDGIRHAPVRSFTINRKQSDDFGGDATPVAQAIIEAGGVLSKAAAIKSGRYEGNKSLWNGAPDKWAMPRHGAKIYGGAKGGERGKMPDQVAADAGFDSAHEMWNALSKESAFAKRLAEQTRIQEREADAAMEKYDAQTKDFTETASKSRPEDFLPIDVEALKVGDVVEVDGEKLEVTNIDEYGNVTLKDGSRFGEQIADKDTVIYGDLSEHEVDAPPAAEPETPPAPAEPAKVPKLRAGEKVGSLFDEEGFNLAGETGVDGERVTREKAEAERKAAEAKADFEKRQMELPVDPPVNPPVEPAKPSAPVATQEESARNKALSDLNRSAIARTLDNIEYRIEQDHRKGIKNPQSILRRDQLRVQLAEIDKPSAPEFTPEQIESGNYAPPGKPDVADSGAPIGPGKMTEGEMGPRTAYSIKHAAIEAQREKEGRPPIFSRMRQKWQDVWDRVEDILNVSPEAADRLVEEIEANPNRGTSDVEQAMLDYRLITHYNDREAAAIRAKDFDRQARTPGISVEERIRLEGQAAAEAVKADHAEKEIDRTEKVARKSGSALGAALNIRKLGAYDDFTIAPMEARLRKAKGAPLTEAEIEEIAKTSKIYKEAEAARDAADEAAKAAKEDAALNQAAADEIKKYAPGFLNRIAASVTKLKSERDTAKADMLAEFKKLGFLGGKASANPLPVEAMTAAAKYLAKEAQVFITEKGSDFAIWSRDIIGELGENVRDLLKPAWDKANAGIDGETAPEKPGKPKAEKPKTPKQKSEKEKADAEAEGTIEGMNAVIEAARQRGEEPKLMEISNYINRLAKEFIEGGETTVRGVLDKLHEVLEPMLGEKQTDKDVLIAWRKYGQGKPAETDPVKQLISQINEEALLTAKIKVLEDGANKLTATGRVKTKSRAEADRLRAQLAEVLRSKPGSGEKTPNQLSSILDAMEKRATNRLRDLRFEIARGERIVKTKTPSPTSEKLEKLRAELAVAEAEHAALFPKREMTPEQRLKAAISAAERSAGKAEAELAEAKKGNFSKAKIGDKFADPTLEAARKRTVAARAEIDALKNAAKPPVSDAEKAQLALNKALVDQERWKQVLSGEITKGKPIPKEALSQMEEDARAEIAAMRQLAADLRADAKPKADPEAVKENAAVAALERAAAEYERRVSAADFGGKAKIHTAETARVAAARAAKDAAKAAHDAAKAAWALTHPEGAIEKRIAQMERQKAELLDRDTKGDFTRKTRKPPVDISGDPAAVKLETELNEIRDAFKRKVKKAEDEREWAEKNWVEKGWKHSLDGWRAAKNLMLSFDFTGALQSLPAILQHPVSAAKVLPKATYVFFNTLFGGNFAERQQTRIMRDPLYHMAVKGGLDLRLGLVRDENMNNVLERMAELDTRWREIPDVLKGVLNLNGKQIINGGAQIAKIIPMIAGRGLKGSNESFQAITNGMRMAAFRTAVKFWFKDRAPTQAELTQITNQINAETGSGGLKASGKGFNISDILFAPNWILSNLKLVSGLPLVKSALNPAKNGRATAIIATRYVHMIAGMTGLFALRALFGDRDKERDPKDKNGMANLLDPKNLLDPNAGSVRMESGIKADMTGGRAKYATLAGRMLAGKRENEYGVLKKTDPSREFMNFLKGRLNRDLTTGLMAITGKNFMGKDIDAGQMAHEIIDPLSWRDFAKILEKEGIAKGAFIQGVNLYLGNMKMPMKKEEARLKNVESNRR